jgi:hypothetical protein
MLEARNKEDRTARGAPDEGNSAAGENVRRPYRAPHLRYLGSVREMTAAGVGSQNEGTNTGRKGRGG